ncbi:hypothetical protein MIND_00994400 [Mycena indigotica]|uniref:Uncharacterized protein n=1 Tax=Mycena indigotica TaxID=2126181 RepID=A0A8H6W067_9AGAR|nr:uncharacterized protein MIND_00994400 [Mycena indigotica]KAF7294579.1 hypothetical protein MIND_00994400 [Mycena indigotica]
MSSLHIQRAKRWGTTPFLAEWLSNMVVYCRSSLEGKKAFQEWITNEYGRERAQEKFTELASPAEARNLKPLPASKEAHFYLAALDLGVSEKAMREYFQFAFRLNLCSPPRVAPAPKRHRGESLADWITRRDAAVMSGSNVPDIDWRVIRAIASSEMQLGADTADELRFDHKAFVDMLALYSPSIILDNKDSNEDNGMLYQRELAFQSQMFILTISNMTWFSVAVTLNKLMEKKLSSTAAIEDAYKNDRSILWRLVSCLCFVSYLCNERWHRLAEMISYSPYFRPFFTRYRTATGEPRIKVNQKYVQEHGYSSELDRLVVQFTESDFSQDVWFMDRLAKFLSENPSEVSKFSEDAYRELSNVEPVVECKSQLVETPFGQKLVKYAISQDSTFQDPEFVHNTTFMDAKRLKRVPRNKTTDWSHAYTVVRSIGNTWRQKATGKTPIRYWLALMDKIRHDAESPELAAALKEGERLRADYAEVGFKGDAKGVAGLLLFDAAWKQIEGVLWNVGRGLEKVHRVEGGAPDALRLYDPESPVRISPIKMVFSSHYKDGVAKYKAEGRPFPPFWGQPRAHSDWIETVDLKFDFDLDPDLDPINDLWTMPGTGNDTEETKVEEVTEKDLFAENSQAMSWADEVEEEFFGGKTGIEINVDSDLMDWGESLPDYLPKKFTIGKKNFKVFQRILPLKSGSAAASDEPAPDVRWSDFEKAMKRIGFGVSRSRVGLAVRFDPPAKMARSVVFHRPYLSPFISPVDSRRLVFCLGTCYRWTSNNFERGSAED